MKKIVRIVLISMIWMVLSGAWSSATVVAASDIKVEEGKQLEGVSVTYGETLANITLPIGYSFEQDLTTLVGDAGVHSYPVKYTDSNGLVTTGYTINITVLPKDASSAKVTGIENSPFTGKPVVFTKLAIVFGNVTLKEQQDYVISYANNIQQGSGEVTITFMGNYQGTIKKNFTVLPPVPLVNQKYVIGNLYYQVMVTGQTAGKVRVVAPVKKTLVSVTIPNTVKINGYVFNITEIGAKAFYKCSKLKTVVISSVQIRSMGSMAFLKLHSKAKIYVPFSVVQAYKAMLKNITTATIAVTLPSIVNKNDAKYSYDNLSTDIVQLAARYPSVLKLRILGKSHDNRNIYCIVMGNPKASKQLVIDGCLHAREWMNGLFIMEKIEYLALNWNRVVYKNCTMAQLLADTCVYIVPMLNPDGVTISQYGPSKIKNATLRKKLLKMSGISQYKVWKSNARGVDLNQNFTQGWSKKVGTRTPGNYYSGASAGSENETKALMRLVESLPNVQRIINYHSMGEVLYYNRGVAGVVGQRINAMVKMIKGLTGYSPIGEKSNGKKSGCLADYCVIKRKIASVTIETGRYGCPLPFSQMARIRDKNKYVLEALFYMSRK